MYSTCANVPTALQRGGRAGRDCEGYGIVIMMYEPWAMEKNLQQPQIDPLLPGTDPDRPLCLLTDRSKRPDRVGLAMLKILQDKETCLRRL